MLSDSKIIALYCIVDDMLKALHHKEDIRVRVSDSESDHHGICSSALFWRAPG